MHEKSIVRKSVSIRPASALNTQNAKEAGKYLNIVPALLLYAQNPAQAGFFLRNSYVENSALKARHRTRAKVLWKIVRGLEQPIVAGLANQTTLATVQSAPSVFSTHFSRHFVPR